MMCILYYHYNKMDNTFLLLFLSGVIPIIITIINNFSPRIISYIKDIWEDYIFRKKKIKASCKFMAVIFKNDSGSSFTGSLGYKTIIYMLRKENINLYEMNTPVIYNKWTEEDKLQKIVDLIT